jgi:hypothetical protein
MQRSSVDVRLGFPRTGQSPCPVRVTATVAIVAATLAYGGDVPSSYAGARANWEKHKDSRDYQAYMSEFIQFNNHFHIDERGGCYGWGQGQVGLMLAITHAQGAEFAEVENVLSDVDSEKARCFIKSYRGLRTKVPRMSPLFFRCRWDSNAVD